MSIILPTQPTCPDNCATAMPVVTFSKCAPKTFAAQISKIYMTSNGENGLTDWTSAAEWLGRLSNSDTIQSAIRTLFVIGSKPKPESQKIKISLGREIVGKKKHTINFKIDELNDENREMQRVLECGGTYLMWFETSSGLLFGDNSGIEVSIESDVIIDEDSGQIIRIEGTLSWEAKFTPKSILSPIAA